MLTLNMTKMSPLSLIVIVLAYLLCGFGCVDSDDSPHPPMVCAPDGCMIGTTMPGWDLNNKFEAFMGIPYAEPPVGPLRFSNPKALPKSKEIVNATVPKSDCIQKNYLMTPPEISGSEDCLYLNVYRPMNRTKVLLPVMVYIHGGGWFSGSASPVITGPEYFMDKNSVILVTIAYRLGPFGFLSTHDKIMPGNFGLKDQTLALRWVQKNIQAFGGNSRWVTLFGQSAGAVSVHLHMMSKLSAGLFGRAIMLSGTANVPFSITDNPLNQTRQLATFCKIEKAEELSTLKLTEALRELNATEILNAADKFKYWHIDTLVNFRAVVEKPILATSFLPYTPVSIQKDYSYRAMPMMFGMVPNEGAVRVVSIYENPKLRSEFNSRFDELLEKILEFPAHFNATKRKEKTEKVIDEYFQGFHELNNYTIRGLIDTITDRGFRNPLYNTIREHIKKVDTFKNPLRLYMFDYLGSRSFANMYTNNPKPRQYGVVHSNDLIYLFRSPLLFPDLVRGSPEELVMKTMVGHLIDFAKSSKPLPIVRACNSKTFYKPECGNEICDYVLFSRGENGTLISKAATDFKVNRMHFWNHLLR